MSQFLNPTFEPRLKSLIYRFRFLGLYIVFGILSLFFEFIIRNYLINLGFRLHVSTIIAIGFGILIAFWTNVNFNFKIPRYRRNRALIYFFIGPATPDIYTI